MKLLVCVAALVVPQLECFRIFRHEKGRPIFTQTACSGTSLRLSCSPEAEIDIVRANFGRFSVSVCSTGLADKAMETRCGDRVTTKLVLRAWCQGLSSCHLPVNSETFGDPCPGRSKFLEVQFRCKTKSVSGKIPNFGEETISEVWNNEHEQPVEIKKIKHNFEIEMRIPSRIPITEPSIMKVFDAVDNTLEIEVIKSDEKMEHSALSIISEEDDRKRTALVTSMACLVMLPLVVFMTLVILFTTNKAEEDSSEGVIQEEEKKVKKYSLNACRYFSFQKRKKNLSKHFYSEPVICDHNLTQETLSPSSKSKLLLNHDIEIYEFE